MINTDNVIGAFAEESAANLAGISLGQLRYWDRTKFFQPSLGFEDRRLSHSRIYSFVDVVGLRALGQLRNEFKVPLQHLRKVAALLKEDQSLWSKRTIHVKNRRVAFDNNEGGYVDPETGEDTLTSLPLPRVMQDVHRRVKASMLRPASSFGLITQDRNILRNAEVFLGTRIPVSAIREYYEAGFSAEDILRDYPSLTEDDITAGKRHLGIKAV